MSEVASIDKSLSKDLSKDLLRIRKEYDKLLVDGDLKTAKAFIHAVRYTFDYSGLTPDQVNKSAVALTKVITEVLKKEALYQEGPNGSAIRAFVSDSSIAIMSIYDRIRREVQKKHLNEDGISDYSTRVDTMLDYYPAFTVLSAFIEKFNIRDKRVTVVSDKKLQKDLHAAAAALASG